MVAILPVVTTSQWLCMMMSHFKVQTVPLGALIKTPFRPLWHCLPVWKQTQFIHGAFLSLSLTQGSHVCHMSLLSLLLSTCVHTPTHTLTHPHPSTQMACTLMKTNSALCGRVSRQSMARWLHLQRTTLGSRDTGGSCERGRPFTVGRYKAAKLLPHTCAHYWGWKIERHIVISQA